MQGTNWNDLRCLLAVKRYGSFGAAAAVLRVDTTTVSRRIRTLQEQLGALLIERRTDGSARLTNLGQAAAERAERIELEVSSLEAEASGSRQNVCGCVRLTSVPMLLNRLVIPNSTALTAAYPDLELQLHPDLTNLSLSKRETDMALRLSRPEAGGLMVKAKRLGVLKHAVYCAKSCAADPASQLPWVTHQEAWQHLPQVKWMHDHVRRVGGTFASVRVGDADSAMEAVARGVGRSVLPTLLADADPRLVRLEEEGTTPDIEREVWIMVHADLASLPRCKVVWNWLSDLFEDAR
ncbi:LysR family transcriptional regulator [Roseibium sp. TrichSKD4]|uniref:LysR family transcriptional regulator n=1 Tax=Roseibium sp. TrichSKD4 TaxID=744980 RepID=UPI0001E57772|nr:LysR family transcriptional regulator [Roseibium sp. TrichSKD4]EFO28893.1 LysR family transcriptional regulator [Roseibium sp. TrichSKD4]